MPTCVSYSGLLSRSSPPPPQPATTTASAAATDTNASTRLIRGDPSAVSAHRNEHLGLDSWLRRLRSPVDSSSRSSSGCRGSAPSTRSRSRPRAGELAKRSIKKEAKLWALELAIRCCDLTTLEGQDTPGKVAALCSKAIRPDPTDPSIPSVAAVCVYPNLVPIAKERLAGTGVKVASVATAFPSGQSPLDVKLRDVRTRSRSAPTRSTW